MRKSVSGKLAAVELAGRVAGEASQEEFPGERLSRTTDGEVRGERGTGAQLEHRRLLLHRSTFPFAAAEDPAVGEQRRHDALDAVVVDVRNRRRRCCRWSWRWRWRNRWWTVFFSWASHVFEQPCCRRGTAGDADDANDVGATDVGEL